MRIQKIGLKVNVAHRSDSVTAMRILVVGMADSVHLGRWLEHFEDSEHEFLIFPSSPHRKIHSKIRSLMERKPAKFKIPSLMRFLALPLWVLDRLADNWVRGFLLSYYSLGFKPQLVHVLEFQNAGYTYLKARKINVVLADVRLLLTPYGSDMYWFMRFPKHERILRQLVGCAAAMSCECQRDEKLATSLGFKGQFMPRVPAFGHVQLNTEMNDHVRDKIMVKGYQNKWGQAANAIRALKIAAPHLQELEIHFFSCNFSTIWRARKLAFETGLNVITHPKGTLSHDDIQKLFASTLIYVGLSKSDGISASMIEAMAGGAIPIQSNTSCCEEWLKDGEGGYLVDFDAITSIADHIIALVTSSDKLAKARERNFSDLLQNLEPTKTKRAVHETYEKLSD